MADRVAGREIRDACAGWVAGLPGFIVPLTEGDSAS